MGVVVTLCGRRHLSDPVRDPLYDDPGWKMEYDFDEVRFNDVTWGAIEVDRSEADNAPSGSVGGALSRVVQGVRSAGPGPRGG